MTIAAVAFMPLILASSSSPSLTTEIGAAATPFTSLTRIVLASWASAAAGSAAPRAILGSRATLEPRVAPRPSRAVLPRSSLRFMVRCLLIRDRDARSRRRGDAFVGGAARSAQVLLQGLQEGEGAPRVAVGLGPARVEADLHRDMAAEIDVLQRLHDAVPVDRALARRPPVGIGEMHVGEM